MSVTLFPSTDRQPLARHLHRLIDSVAARDAVLILGAALTLHFVLLPFDAMERFFDFSKHHESWELDELLSLAVSLALGGFVFGLRRIHQVRAELLGRIAAEERARTQALHDPLTGLPNRRKLFEKLESSLAARGDPGSVTALIMIDLDRFKPINDVHGHAAGDVVLKTVSQRISDVTRAGEMVARLGGDEFAVVLPKVRSAADAARPARRILQALNEPIAVGELACRISGSLGVAVSDGGVGATDLMRFADAALYAAKRAGRNQVHFFEPEMDAELQRRAQLEVALRQGISAGEIRPAYQPLVDLASERVLGYEMLARWDHPVNGPIPPDVFIPIAEDTGQIGDLLMSLLDQAFREAAAWPDHTILAINVSPIQLRDADFPDQLLAAADEAGFPPHRLEVEITESAVVADVAAARTALLALKARGVRIALDDFGTGYSSLHHLRELPFDKLKIDRSFIMSMQDSEESRNIVDAIVGMGRSLGLTTLAEGVESAADAERLRSLGCAMGQGYHFGRPMAANPSH